MLRVCTVHNQTMYRTERPVFQHIHIYFVFHFVNIFKISYNRSQTCIAFDYCNLFQNRWTHSLAPSTRFRLLFDVFETIKIRKIHFVMFRQEYFSNLFFLTKCWKEICLRCQHLYDRLAILNMHFLFYPKLKLNLVFFDFPFQTTLPLLHPCAREYSSVHTQQPAKPVREVELDPYILLDDDIKYVTQDIRDVSVNVTFERKKNRQKHHNTSKRHQPTMKRTIKHQST